MVAGYDDLVFMLHSLVLDGRESKVLHGAERTVEVEEAQGPEAVKQDQNRTKARKTKPLSPRHHPRPRPEPPKAYRGSVSGSEISEIL